jgi:hypothetical protein
MKTAISFTSNHVSLLAMTHSHTLQFGTNQLLPTKVFRFNPHDTPTIKLGFDAKLKVLVQRVRRYLTQTLEEEVPVASVEWFFFMARYCCVSA